MIARGMEGWRNPARYLAPLAIAAVAAASYVIVHKALMHKHSSSGSLSIVQTSTTRSSKTTTHHVSTKGKFYVVRPNDTMSKISARTGVSLTVLEQLNPNVNPDALHVQQRIRLRR
jgi:LysM repeat protein